MSMATNVKAIRKANFISLIREHGGASALAKLIGTSASYISQIMSPKTNVPIGERLARRIEEALALGAGWMDTDHEGVSEAGAPIASDEDVRALASRAIVMTASDRPRLRRRPLSSRAFAYLMRSDDMQPAIPQGSYLIVDPELEPKPGSVCLIASPAGTFVRELSQNFDGSVILKAANPAFPPAVKGEDTKIVGVVTDAHRPLI